MPLNNYDMLPALLYQALRHLLSGLGPYNHLWDLSLRLLSQSTSSPGGECQVRYPLGHLLVLGHCGRSFVQFAISTCRFRFCLDYSIVYIVVLFPRVSVCGTPSCENMCIFVFLLVLSIPMCMDKPLLWCAVDNQ